MRMDRVAAAFVVFATSCGAAVAQDSGYTYPPASHDLAPGYEFDGGNAPDIVGVKPGMTREEAASALSAAVPGGDLGPDMGGGETAFSIGDNRGTQVGFLYYPSDRIEGPSERVSVVYSTGITGQRVTEVARHLEFGDDAQPSLPDFVKALEAKYGPATARQEPSRGAAILSLWFGWVDGKRAMLGPAEAKEFPGVILHPSALFACMSLGFNRGGYIFSQDRKDDWPGCTAVLSVQIFTGRRDDLIRSVDMDLYDHRRWFDSAVAADAYLLDAYKAALSGAPTAPAPKL